MTPRGDIRDIKHVVILMPENRSFDHYFGSLRGVRGFGDRATILLPGDLPAWQQPDTAPGQPTTGSAEHCTDPDRDTGGWYDLHVTIDSDSAWSQRFTGHLETGAPSVTG